MQHFLKIGGKRYGEVSNFKKVRKFASSNLKFRSSKFKFTEILICNPGIRRHSLEVAHDYFDDSPRLPGSVEGGDGDDGRAELEGHS